MKTTSIAAALAGAMLLCGAPSLALAQGASAGPIQLDNVEIERSFGIEHQLYPGLVHVRFTNTASAAVTQVDFALQHADGTLIREYHDVGPFAAGATMTHEFPDIHTAEDQKLVVDTVTFADGTQWSAPNDAPSTLYKRVVNPQ